MEDSAFNQQCLNLILSSVIYIIKCMLHTYAACLKKYFHNEKIRRKYSTNTRKFPIYIENYTIWKSSMLGRGKNFFPVSQRKKLIFQVAHASHKRAKAATAVYKKTWCIWEK